MECPRCGQARQPEDDECPHCGIHYDYVEKKLAKEGKESNPPVEQNDQTKALPEKIKTACPVCGQKYKVQSKQIGIKTKCKKCSSVFTITEINPDVA